MKLELESQATMEEEIMSSTMIKAEALEFNRCNSSQRGRPSSNSKSHKQQGLVSAPSRYKGVVTQSSGNWGAQIYVGRRRIWLGTFKTEAAAAAAYDSAAIKLHNSDSGDSYRNFPWSTRTIHEPTFQSQYSTDQVLSMIKNGSYPAMFGEFLSYAIQVGNDHTNPHNNKKESCIYQELLRKELTPSDVGKLNRLVIPKRYALKLLPKIYAPDNPGITESDVKVCDMELTFFDKSMKAWRFRYCYWKSSQSFVFTRGWKKFVIAKHLKAKDTLVFYRCEVRENNGKDVKKYLMIHMESNASLDSTSSVTRVADEKGMEENKDSLRKGDEEETLTVNDKEKKGFRLFGVRIS